MYALGTQNVDVAAHTDKEVTTSADSEAVRMSPPG